MKPHEIKNAKTISNVEHFDKEINTYGYLSYDIPTERIILHFLNKKARLFCL